jgi:beta-galactosidase
LRLNSYVQNGGTLFTDCRSGEKDEFNRIHERSLPGLLGKSLGISIDDISCMYDDMSYSSTKSELFENKSFTVHQYCEWVKPVKAEGILFYREWQMEESALLTRNEYGNGKGWYLGGIIKETRFYDQLIKNLLKDAGIQRCIENKPPGVEIVTREDHSREIIFIINHTGERQSVSIPFEFKSLSGPLPGNGTLRFEAFDVAILKKHK